MLKPGSSVHVLGACGTAMATLAAMLAERGHRVRGSDQDVYPPMSDFLRARGIPLASPYAESNLDPEPDLVIVGNAIPRGNPEIEAVLDRGLRYRSLPEVLREEFLEGRHSVVVAGTHGKTTTTALLGQALVAAGLDPSVLVGGYAHDLGGSYRLGRGAPFVVEGDEYDSAYFDKAAKFLKYFPRTLVVTSLEYDHADIYPDLAAIQLQFRRLVNQVPRRGLVLVGDGCEAALDAVSRSHAPVERFGMDEGSTWRAVGLEESPVGTAFTVVREGREMGSVRLPLSGAHNVRNALAAIAAGTFLGGAFGALADGLAQTKGVKRRLERRGEERGVLVYDDFAHHPTAIRETLRAVRSRHPGRRLWGVFEPRSWTSRRNVMQSELGEALATADLVVLAEVFQPERLADAVRLDPRAVVAFLEGRGVEACVLPGAREIATRIGGVARPGDVVVVMSNGGFDGVHELLLDELRRRGA